ncbi:cell surface protein, CscA/DUF916 family [Lactiplantibacillus plantarum]|nr:cell surface protein, CscA/DUF916 family [Lactiplantibacillus plantarum]
MKKAAKQQSKSAMAIKNQYAYSVAVVLHGKQALTKNKLTLGKIKATQNNGYNLISLALQNHTAAFLNQVTTEVKVYRRGVKKSCINRRINMVRWPLVRSINYHYESAAMP